MDPALAQWALDHELTFEIAPHHAGRGEISGEDVLLFARHPALREGDPGCEECQRIFTTLRDIAGHVAPGDSPGVRVGLSPFDASFRMRPQSGWAPEVVLEIAITPLGGGAGDDALRRCVRRVERGLLDLGAQSGAWRSPG